MSIADLEKGYAHQSCTLRGSDSKKQTRLHLVEARNRLGLAGGDRPELCVGLNKRFESPGQDPGGSPDSEAPS